MHTALIQVMGEDQHKEDTKEWEDTLRALDSMLIDKKDSSKSTWPNEKVIPASLIYVGRQARLHTPVLRPQGLNRTYRRAICPLLCKATNQAKARATLVRDLSKVQVGHRTTHQLPVAQPQRKSSPIKLKSREALDMGMVHQAAPSPETSPTASLTSCETETKQPETETATTCHKASSTSKTTRGLTYPLQAEGAPRNKREPTARPPATP